MSKLSSVERNLGRRIFGVTMPIKRKRARWGRNRLCMCGSDEKYKNCCCKNTEALTLRDGNANVVELSEDIQKLIKIHKESITAVSEGGIRKKNRGESHYEGRTRKDK